MSAAPDTPPEPLTEPDLAAIRRHPRFRELVEARAATSLAAYHALPPGERWLLSDLGRTSLTGAALVLSAWRGLTLGALVGGMPVENGVASPGRVRAFVTQAMAYGLIMRADGDEAGPLTLTTPLVVSPRLRAVLNATLPHMLEAVTTLEPAVAAALPRAHDPVFQDRLSAWLGVLTRTRPDLYEGSGRPVHLFQGRDGGSRMLEALIARQVPGRTRLLEACPLSRSELARASLSSRTHVNRLLADGEAAGLLSVEDGVLTCSAALSDDVERYNAISFALVRTGAMSVLAQG